VSRKSRALAALRGHIASPLCYIVAMSSKHRFPATALLFLALVCQVSAAQTGKPATPGRSSKLNTPAPASAAPTAPANTLFPSDTSANPACTSGPCDEQQPHITIATAAPAPAPWSLQDRIKWLAVVLLVLAAHMGVWLAVSALHKIERQTHFVEAAALAAVESAKAALSLAENQARAVRPWILVMAEPTPAIANSFSVVATNRGSSPARIVALAEGIAIVEDEAQLPAAPAFKTEPRAALVPHILLPGESATIKTFTRDEVKSICENPWQLLRVENWEEKIYLYGNVAYVDLVASGGEPHETNWCCWYIHGRQKSGMVMAGSAEYSRHS
jgi:hypothetical protein